MRYCTTRTGGVVAALCAASLMAGCGEESSPDAVTAKAPASRSQAADQFEPFRKRPATLPELAPLDQAPAKGKTVVYVNTGSGAAAEIGKSIRRATQGLGWRYRSITYNVANPASANSAYLTAVNSGAAGIVSTGVPAAAIQGGIDAARGKDIPVVLINSSEPPEAEEFHQVGNVGVTAPLWSKAAALGAIADAEKRGDTAHVGVVTSSGIPVLKSMTDAMIKAVEQQCAECSAKPIDVSAPDLASGQASKSVVSFIQRNPKTNYVNMVVGSFEGGLRPALNAAGLDDVQIFGTQPTPTQNQEVAKGGSLFWVQIPYGYEAWSAVDAIARAVTGGDAAVHNDAELPVWIVDKDNLDFDPAELPAFPTDYERQFKKLWKVG